MAKVPSCMPEEEGRGHGAAGELNQHSGYTDGHTTSLLALSIPLGCCQEGTAVLEWLVGISFLLILTIFWSAKETYTYQ